MNLKKFLMIFSMLSFMILAFVHPAGAILINSVTVTEPDTFYSSVANNSVVRLLVNVTGVNSTPGNTVTVTANFISLGVRCNSDPGSSTISLANNGSGIWSGLCDVGEEASSSAFKSGQIIVIANETYGAPSVNTNLILSIYNIGVPSETSCYRFGEGSTNFNEVTNFNDVDITLIVEANTDSSCIPQAYNWDVRWLRVGKLRFNGVNFGNNAVDVQKLSQLSNIVKLKFSPPKTYQDTRVSVDTVTLPELDVNTFNIELYHISLMMPNDAFIVSDNNVVAEAVTWKHNGYVQMMNDSTYNLTFTVNQGFKGYNITDSIIPTSTLHGPVNGLTTNESSIIVNFTVNGTGTGISKVFFYVNGILSATLNNTVNTANCTPVTSNLEVYNCVFALARSDGTYNLSVVAYDFGKSPGNQVTSNALYNIQTGSPYVKISVPKDDGKYSGLDGSMLKMTFNVTDGNGIGACWYTLDGPTSADDELIKGCKSGINSLQLYLESGSYDLDLYVNDTLGSTSKASVSFDVSDVVAPKILNKTVKISRDEATLTLTTDESASCRYSPSDRTYTQMNGKFVDNTTIHTAVFDVSERDSEDISETAFIYYILCSDLSDNTDDGSLVIDLLNIDHTAPASEVDIDDEADAAEIDPSETFDLGLLLAGKKILNVDNADIPFTDILLTTNSASDDVVVKVTALSDSSVDYPEKVYSYISVEHWSIKESNIVDALIKFRVSEDWLEQNNFSKSDVVLFRYTDKWVALNTTRGSTDDGYVTYTADSPGLSLFAISKIHVENPAVSNHTINSTNTTVVNATTVVPDIEDPDGGSFNWIWVLVGIVVFVLVALFILVERNERNSPPPIFPQDKTLMSKIRRVFR